MALRKGELDVVIPVYNDAQNLAECLGALQRARGEHEMDVVVVDDGSTDASGGIAEAHGCRCIKQLGNQGQSTARNLGAASAQSRYVLFLDSDVIVSPDCLARVEEFIRSTKPDKLVGLQGYFALAHPYPEWSSQIYNAIQHLVTVGLNFCSGINTSFCLLSRKVFAEVGGFQDNMVFMEDNELSERLASRGEFFLRGTIGFIHRKYVSWKWLIQVMILGGRMVYWMAKQRAPLNQLGRVKPWSQTNTFLARWLVWGGLTMVSLAIWPALPNNLRLFYLLGLGLPFLAVMLRDLKVILRMNRNILFFFTGWLCFYCIPWLIVFGRLSAPWFGSKQPWGEWRANRIHNYNPGASSAPLDGAM